MITHTGLLHKVLFPSLVWRMPSKKIFLTFDDGPHPRATAKVLDVLKRHRIRATFFLSGQNIPGNEHIVSAIAAAGHSIGIHAFNHSRSLAFSKRRTRDEIQQTKILLDPLVGRDIRLFRPPFGFFSCNTVTAARELKFIIVMWSCLTGDFRHWPESKIVGTALRKIGPGSILVFHDNDLTEDSIQGVLDQTILEIQKMGFEFGAIR